MQRKPAGRAQRGSEGNTVATRRGMDQMNRPAALQLRAMRASNWRSTFVYVILIGNCFGIASLVAKLKPELMSDNAYTLCVTMIDVEILLVLLAFFIQFTDGRLTQPLYQEASSIWENLATRDALTGLGNRLSFMHALDEELVQMRRRRTQCAVLFIDLNRFKQINDTHGHAVGDSVISIAARRIYQAISPKDIAARLGGDEFAVLLRDVTMGQAQRLADELEKLIRAPMTIEDKTVAVTASIGVRMSDDKSKRAEEMLHDADLKMYKAKAAARWQRSNAARVAVNPNLKREGH